jgi:hypothetical protein
VGRRANVQLGLATALRAAFLAGRRDYSLALPALPRDEASGGETREGVPLEDVQRLAGRTDSRVPRLYDRRQKRITCNIVQRISI